MEKPLTNYPEQPIPDGVGIILEQEGKILLQLRDNDPNIRHPNCWSYIVGRVQKGDAFVESAIEREVGEKLKHYQEKKLMPVKPEEIMLLDVRQVRLEPEGVFQKQYTFTGQLYVPLEDIVVREGQKVELFTEVEFRRLNVPKPYRDRIRFYFANKIREATSI